MDGAVLPGFFSLLAWAILFGSTGLSLILGFILSFHWYRYAMNQSVALVATIIYSAGCIVILALLLGSVIAVS